MIDNNFTNLPEIAAPVGDLEMLRSAVRSGADAVYVGLKQFSARAFAKNFTIEDLHFAAGYCHARGVRIFVAINTLIYNEELPQLVQAINDIAAVGVDAVIIQDMAVLSIAKKVCPSLALHASTQCSALTANGVKFLADSGFKRVVIGREAGKAEIAAAVKTGAELEVFVHGALCYSVSGGCYMSAFLGGRSANRGRCASPCRLPYRGDDDKTTSLLSLRDLSNLDKIPQLASVGVASIKIEGRMRTPEYVAAAVDAAIKGRQGIAFDRETLTTVFSHGGFTNGYFNGTPDPEIFGARLDRDAALTRAVLPKLHALYRNERQSVPIDLELILTENKLTIQLSCNGDVVSDTIDVVSEPTERSQEKALTNALCKLGGTPFYASNITLNIKEGVFVPASVVSTLRRTLADRLLNIREKITPHAVNQFTLPAVDKHPKVDKKRLRIRISSIEQLSSLSALQHEQIEHIILPVEIAQLLPKVYIDKAIAEYSRGCSDSEILRLHSHAVAEGIYRHAIENPSHFAIIDSEVESYTHGGFGLNITNCISLKFYQDKRLADITLSPEVAASSTVDFAGKTGVIGYGHIPLMLSAAIPSALGENGITDRKSKVINAVKRHDFVELLNPVPLYIGDRQNEFMVDFFTLYFTNEDPKRVAEILTTFTEGKGFDGEFTRGLYY